MLTLKLIHAIFSFSTAEVDEPAENRMLAEDPHRMAVYLHPVSPLIASRWDDIPYLFAGTFEWELQGGRSAVVQLEYGTKDRGSLDPFGQVDWNGSHDDYIYYRLWALRASMRLYRNRQTCNGLYVAPSLEYTDMDSRTASTLKQVKALSVLAYGGFRAKWSRFTAYADLGVGYMILYSGTVQKSGSDASMEAYDIGGNVGVGIPF